MKLSRILRRSIITIVAAGYYIAVVFLTGLSTNLKSMSQFFGHALIYAAGVGLISSVLFIAERASSKRKEEDLVAEAIGHVQNQRRERNA
jgi:predicted transporter